MNKDLLNELFTYRDGNLYWRSTGSGRGDITKPAGTFDRSNGYIKITINLKSYSAHQVIWAMHNEWQPKDKHVDHINGDRSDNHIENLRLATVSENARNRKLASNNRSGFNGVRYSPTRQGKPRWAALITVEKKVIPLGWFAKLEDAINARKEADKQYGYSNGTR